MRRIAAIGVAIVIVAGIAVVLARPAPSPSTQQQPQPAARTSLGVATVALPAPERLITTKQWGEGIPADQLAFRLADGLGRSDADRVAASLSARIVGEIALINTYQAEGPWRTEAELTSALSATRSTTGVTLALPMTWGVGRDADPCTPVNPLADPAYNGGKETNTALVGLADAWSVLRASGVPLANVHVGMVDEPVWSRSGELAGDVKTSGLGSGDFTPDVALATALSRIGGLGHGTAVAQVLAGAFGNGGVAGVASVLGNKLSLTARNAYRMPATMGNATYLYDLSMIADLQKQVDAGATVINASWGAHTQPGDFRSDLFRAFAEQVLKNRPDVTFVVAGGNRSEELNGKNDLLAGLPLDNVITVGGVDPQGKHWSDGPRALAGGEVTIAAPSTDVVVGSDASGGAITSDGTSFAAPMVSGTAALLRAVNPKLTAKELKSLLVRSAATIETGEAPVLRVDRAVLLALNDVRPDDQKLKLDTPADFDRAVASMKQLGAIDVSAAQKDSLHWTVFAKVPGVAKSGTDVKIEFQGQGGPTGGTKHLGAAGSVDWPYAFNAVSESTTVTVTRLDTSACGRVSFKAGGPAPSPSAGPLSQQQVFNNARAALGWGDGAATLCPQRCLYTRVLGTPPNETRISLETANGGANDVAATRRARATYPGTIADFTRRGLSGFTYAMRESVGPSGKPGEAWVMVAGGSTSFLARATCQTFQVCTPELPTKYLDALIDAGVAGGLIPAGTVR